MERKSYPTSKKISEMFMTAINGYKGFADLSKEGKKMAHITLDGEEFFLFFRSLSPEGGKRPIENQRAQLPKHDDFNEVIESTTPFLFLGYDMDNDVFVCWDPNMIRSRLNKKTYVSFYSRLSMQTSVADGEIKEEQLCNGDKIVLFKRRDSLSFLQMIESHFKDIRGERPAVDAEQEPETKETRTENTIPNEIVIGKLFDVKDDAAVKLLVDSMMDSSKLVVVSSCMNQFGKFYSNMTLKDWFKIVQDYCEKQEEIIP